MKIISTAFQLCAVSLGYFALIYTFSSKQLLTADPDPLGNALHQIETRFQDNLDSLAVALDRYQAVATRPDASLQDIQRVHAEARLAFKRVEWLLSYVEPASVTRYLNGAPLPKTEPSVAEVVVIKPKGLQTLDEMAYDEEIQMGARTQVLSELINSYGGLRKQMRWLRPQHRYVFEALREEAIRVFTLGVTGFDTPGSVAALPEAEVALATMERAYRPYAAAVAEVASESNRQILEAFRAGREQVRAGDFDSFDRLRFLRVAINPLTRELPRAQRALGIEFASDDARLTAPVNQAPLALFDEDFLNAEHFAALTPTEFQEERRALGEKLFFDPILSKNGTMSCATCHQPDKAFTDGYAKSLSADGEGTVMRNSPTLINSVYATHYFHDLREEFLERQMMHVVADENEFGTDFVAIEKTLAANEEYAALFASAYGVEQPRYQLSKWSISDAISQYILSLRSIDSPFDRYARGESEVMPADVRRGFNLFMGKAACGTCHFAPTFSGLVPPLYADSETEVLGVPAHPEWANATVDPDPGRIASGKPRDEVYFNAFAFKTPTVRNITATAPYMHNGVYTDLEQVMRFYNVGGGAGIGIELDHQTLPPDPLGLTQSEIDDVITFVRHLDDYEALNRRPEEGKRR